MTEPTRTPLDHRDRSQRQDRNCSCGDPLRNSRTFCDACEKYTRRQLANQEAYRADLVVEATRQAKKQPESEGVSGGGSAPLQVELAAAALLRRQRIMLVDWSRALFKADPSIQPPAESRVMAMSVYVEAGLKVFRRHEEGPRLVAEVDRLSRDILKMIDVPENRTRVHVGPCPERYPTPDGPEDWCPGQVVAIIPADDATPAMMECSACKAGWDTTQWNRTGHRIEQRKAALAEAKRLAELMVRRTA